LSPASVIALPGSVPQPLKEATVDINRIPPVGDPFTAVPHRDDQDGRSHPCIGGVVYIGHLVEEDGEEVEVVEAVPCRCCADSR
jgi:hypothetical protein